MQISRPTKLCDLHYGVNYMNIMISVNICSTERGTENASENDGLKSLMNTCCVQNSTITT